MDNEPLDFDDAPVLELEVKQAKIILQKYFPDKSESYLKDCSIEIVEHFRVLHARE